MVFRFTAVGVVVLAGVASCTPAVRVDVSGGWTGTYTYTSGPATGFKYTFALNLVDDEGAVTGSGSFPSSGSTDNFVIPITRGEVHADTVVLEASGQNTYTNPATPVRFTFDGNVTATTMSGVGTHVVGSVSYGFTWQATLTSPPAPES